MRMEVRIKVRVGVRVRVRVRVSSPYVLITASSLRAPPGALAWAWLNLNETSAGARMAAARSTAALPPKPAAVGSPPPPLLPRVPMSPTSTESWSTYG